MIETARLRLRPFEERDRGAMRALWADPVFTADLGGARDAQMTDALIARHESYRAAAGLGFWVTERLSDGALIGYCGLKPGAEGTPAAGEIEIGWSLRPADWGRGYAVEAASAARDRAFGVHDAPRIAAITARRNIASRRVMDRIGMWHAGDFLHPNYAADDPAADSVYYTLDRAR